MFYRTIGLVPWTEGVGPATSDHSGLTIDQGLSEYGGGLSISATRGLSGYRNFFISLFEDFINEFKWRTFRGASQRSLHFN